MTRYSTTGLVAELPPLQNPRGQHGCGAYTRDDGTKVPCIALDSKLSSCTANSIASPTQVLLVAGGLEDANLQRFSTELLVGNANAWIVLPNSNVG